ncbi:MAG: hypothetical protein V4512_06860 [Pseudomonadota bacterium]
MRWPRFNLRPTASFPPLRLLCIVAIGAALWVGFFIGLRWLCLTVDAQITRIIP